MSGLNYLYTSKRRNNSIINSYYFIATCFGYCCTNDINYVLKPQILNSIKTLCCSYLFGAWNCASLNMNWKLFWLLPCWNHLSISRWLILLIPNYTFYWFSKSLQTEHILWKFLIGKNDVNVARGNVLENKVVLARVSQSAHTRWNCETRVVDFITTFIQLWDSWLMMVHTIRLKINGTETDLAWSEFVAKIDSTETSTKLFEHFDTALILQCSTLLFLMQVRCIDVSMSCVIKYLTTLFITCLYSWRFFMKILKSLFITSSLITLRIITWNYVKLIF